MTMDMLEQASKFRAGIQRSFFLVPLLALLLAVIADLLSIVDVGWIISWSIPPTVWLMARRTTGILQTHGIIVSADEEVRRQFRIAKQQAAAIGISYPRYLPQGTSEKIRSSYTTVFLRDTAATQLIELVPVVDILPFYLGQVVKSLYDQHRAVKKARKALLSYETALSFFLELQNLIDTYQAEALPQEQPRRSAPPKKQAQPGRIADIQAPAYAP